MKYGPSLAITRPSRRLGGGLLKLTSNVIVLGSSDSTFAGVGAGDGSGTNPEISNARRFCPPVQAAVRLQARGVQAFSDTVCQDNGNGMGTKIEEYRSDIESSGGYATSSRSPNIGGFVPRLSSGAQYLIFTPSVSVDTFKFGNLFGSGFGPIGVAIDGDTPDDYAQDGANGYVTETIDGLTLGPHDIEFTQSGTYSHGPGYIWAYDSNIPAFHMFNAGVRNSTIGDHNVATYPSSPLSALDTLLPDVMVEKHAINDVRNGGAETSYEDMIAAYETRMDKAHDIGARVILVIPHDIGSYSGDWDASEVRAMFEEVKTYAEGKSGIPAVALVDVPQAIYDAGLSGATEPASFAAVNALGLMYDGLHAKAPIQIVEGAAIADALGTMYGVTMDAVPDFTVSAPTFTVAASTAAGADPQGYGDETDGSFSLEPTNAFIVSGTNADHWQIVDGYKLSPSLAGDAANLSGGPYSLGVCYVYGGVVRLVTVTINIT